MKEDMEKELKEVKLELESSIELIKRLVMEFFCLFINSIELSNSSFTSLSSFSMSSFIFINF
jgi:hypothetical protein